MKFKDRLVRCAACGAEFVYTVPEQRRRAAQGKSGDSPAFCSECRGADVRLAEAAGAVEPDHGDPVMVSDREDSSPQDQSKRRRRSPMRHDGGTSDGSRTGTGGKPRARSKRRGGPRQRSRPRQTEIRVRHFGTVKWFDETRGFGFIAEDNGDELFVHASGVLTVGQTSLEQGQSVEYEVEHTDRGLQAVDVVAML